MVKVSVIHRDPAEFVQQRPGQLQRTFSSKNPHLHPFQREREYTRAVTAVKLQKLFAKPLLFCVEGHRDSVKCLTRSRTRVASFWSGSCNGEVAEWNLAAPRKCVKIFAAHDGFVRGLTTSPKDRLLLSGGDDRKIKAWKQLHASAAAASSSFSSSGSLSTLDVALLQQETTSSCGAQQQGGGSSSRSRGRSAATACAQEGDIRHAEDKEGGEEEEDLLQLHWQQDDGGPMPALVAQTPLHVYTAASPVTSLDYHPRQPLFVSAGENIDVWNQHRASPLHTFSWDCDVVHAVRFNAAEPCLIAATGADNSVGIYDLRGNTPIRKVLLRNRCNAVCWNPMQPSRFIAACEDHQLYSFDMRRLHSPLLVHKDFVNAVLDVDVSPTGAEFAAASFDGTLRIFGVDDGRSRDVYHTKRMQSVLCCKYTGDGRFVLTGSADMTLRVWKSDAAAPLAPRNARERQALAYRKKLVETFAHLKEIKRIARHHHVPKLIHKKQEIKRVSENARKRREENLRRHRRPGSVPVVPEKKKAVYKEIE